MLQMAKYSTFVNFSSAEHFISKCAKYYPAAFSNFGSECLKTLESFMASATLGRSAIFLLKLHTLYGYTRSFFTDGSKEPSPCTVATLLVAQCLSLLTNICPPSDQVLRARCDFRHNPEHIMTITVPTQLHWPASTGGWSPGFAHCLTINLLLCLPDGGSKQISGTLFYRMPPELKSR